MQVSQKVALFLTMDFGGFYDFNNISGRSWLWNCYIENWTTLSSKESDTVTEVAAKRIFFLLAQAKRWQQQH